MIIAVGSQNPTKVNAVKKVFNKVFGNCTVVGVKVSSDVSDMPMSFDESFKGAKNRAKNAFKEIKKADFAVGLEGGFEETNEGTFLCGYAAVIDKKGNFGIGGSSRVLVPEKIMAEVKKGKELSEVIDQLTGQKDIHTHNGTVGYLTNNLLPRTKWFEITLICALSRFMKKDLYKG